MKEDETLKVLKEAILLERKGQAFYRTVAEGNNQAAVKEFFEKMADEEEKHATMLSEQYRSYQSDNRFIAEPEELSGGGDVAMQVLGERVRERIASAGFEAAAISAAMLMEEKSIQLYSGQAEQSTDENEKAMYLWLAKWEKGHLKLLSEMDQALKENIWFDNNFWPF